MKRHVSSGQLEDEVFAVRRDDELSVSLTLSRSSAKQGIVPTCSSLTPIRRRVGIETVLVAPGSELPWGRLVLACSRSETLEGTVSFSIQKRELFVQDQWKQ